MFGNGAGPASSVEAWIKVDAYDEQRAVLSHFSEYWDGHEPYQLRLMPGGELRFSITDSSDQSENQREYLHDKTQPTPCTRRALENSLAARLQCFRP